MQDGFRKAWGTRFRRYFITLHAYHLHDWMYTYNNVGRTTSPAVLFVNFTTKAREEIKHRKKGSKIADKTSLALEIGKI